MDYKLTKCTHNMTLGIGMLKNIFLLHTKMQTHDTYCRLNFWPSPSFEVEITKLVTVKGDSQVGPIASVKRGLLPFADSCNRLRLPAVKEEADHRPNMLFSNCRTLHSLRVGAIG